jgi:hypothetical protein
MRADIKRYFQFLVIVAVLVLLASCNNGPAEKTSGSKTPAETQTKTRTPKEPEGTETKTPIAPQAGDHSMKVLNDPPQIKSAKFVGESASSAQIVVDASDPDGDPVTLRYAWTVNGEKVPADGDTLTDIKRGDNVQVLITPNDGRQDGEPKGLFTIIKNHPPKIEPNKPQFDDPHWTLQIKATDADGDPLQYSLVSGPPGMTVSGSGFVSWSTTGVAAGTYAATVAVGDGQGGSTQWSFNIVLGPTPSAEEGQ